MRAVDANRFLRRGVIATAMIGYVLGYSGIYLFHLVAAGWLLFSTALIMCSGSVQVSRVEYLLPIGLIFSYTVTTVMWHPDMVVWARYHFYFVSGIVALLSVYQSIDNREQLDWAFRFIGVLLGVNLFVGILESLGVMRLPMSPYSPHSSYFGIEGINLADLRPDSEAIVSRKPTGFNANPNTFGFVLMLALPFFALAKNKLVVFGGFIVTFWLMAAIGSRGHFLALLFLFALLPFYRPLSWKRLGLLAAMPGVLIAGVLLVGLLAPEFPGVARMLDVFDQLARGLRLMGTGQIDLFDSVGTRAEIYLFGLREFLSNPAFGLGFGGAEARLTQEGFGITSFHFFFLQMLIDLGALVFVLFMCVYLGLAFSLRRIALRRSDAQLAYIAGACSLSLLVAIPASLSPSGVHYVLGYYVLGGFSLAILKVARVCDRNLPFNFPRRHAVCG